MDRKVNFGVLSVLSFMLAVFVYDFGDAHPGRTDAKVWFILGGIPKR